MPLLLLGNKLFIHTYINFSNYYFIIKYIVYILYKIFFINNSLIFKRRNYFSLLAVMSFEEYILGFDKRHPNNNKIDRNSGNVFILIFLID